MPQKNELGLVFKRRVLGALLVRDFALFEIERWIGSAILDTGATHPYDGGAKTREFSIAERSTR